MHACGVVELRPVILAEELVSYFSFLLFSLLVLNPLWFGLVAGKLIDLLKAAIEANLLK